MTKEDLINELSSISRDDLMDVMMCLMENHVLSVKDLFGIYEKRMENMLSKAKEDVNTAEGHVFEMLYPCLYDTRQLSEQSKDIVSRAISFVRKQGLHRTESLTEKLNVKGTKK